MQGTHGRLAAAFLVVLATVIAVCPAGASAAEVVVEAPSGVSVRQGEVVRFAVGVRATGQIDCLVGRGNPAIAAIDTSHTLVGGAPASSGESGRLAFYSDNQGQLLPPAQCGVTWDGAPSSYTVPVTLAVAPNTPPGSYRLPVRARTANPSSAIFAPLTENNVDEVTVAVAPPPSSAAELAGPRENVSVNLIPVRGRVTIRYPGGGSFLGLPGPAQVPPGTRVDTTAGVVQIVSDRTGTGEAQSAEFWDGVFDVGYTRQLRPERGAAGGQAPQPYTELQLARRTGASLAVAAKGRKGVWGNGRGRFRTKGAYGAGTVRGTHWFTGETAAGTYVKVRRGRVEVSDFTVRRRVTLRAKQSYLARRPHRRRGRTRG